MRKLIYQSLSALAITFLVCACAPPVVRKATSTRLPASYAADQIDTLNSSRVNWRAFFNDPYLAALIDSALVNNQEMNIVLQEIEISRNEVRARKSEYLPFVGLGAGAGVEKVGRYTHQGATDATTEYEPGKMIPEPLQDYFIGAFASWEVDVWKKLRNARKSAMLRYLSTIEGKNFLVTQLVSEIAHQYYELLALDKQLEILNNNIAIQQNALGIVRQQKLAARATELAVRKFEAEVLKNRSLLYYAKQRIIETENRLNVLIGRYPQQIARQSGNFISITPHIAHVGIPAHLLENRPDVRQAELELSAANIDIDVARAAFYPSLGISGGIGFRAFDAGHLVKTPESFLYTLAGDLAAPLINRNAIKAAFNTANAKQVQAVYQYERTLLNAYTEVVTQVSNIANMEQSFRLREQEVEALTESISISENLFKSARAEYMEVLLTQRDALESKFELVETRKEQLNATVSLYHALGGGWR